MSTAFTSSSPSRKRVALAANSSAMSRSSAVLRAAVCGLTRTFGSAHSGLSFGQRFGREHVKGREPDATVAQRRQQSVLVDHRASADVDQDRPRLDRREDIGPDQLLRRRRPGSVSTMASTCGTVDTMSSTWISRST